MPDPSPPIDIDEADIPTQPLYSTEEIEELFPPDEVTVIELPAPEESNPAA